MKARMKYEIAMAAGMSRRTMTRWFTDHRKQVEALGVNLHQQLLPPKVVSYVCHELGLDERDF